ncbi:DUF1292 domain-containing protein [uncultured Clostridium sp.]|uniref:DUF1292 domain-containing protein n=1 Tax=uncultured Clostridium sp. TaxID=59620 RepID=UPI002634676A|nr:DUF1292 domain-containing protein [uncultured Clostridium sp.]
MSDKEKNCCGGHGADHSCGDDCGCGHEHLETLVVDLEREDGTIVSCEIIDTFEFNEVGYALVYNEEEEGVYLFKEVGEEGEIIAVEDEAEFNAASKFYEENVAE